MTKYQDKRTNAIGKVIAVDNERKTVTIEFEGGETKPYTMSTVRRWFRKVDEDAPVSQAVETVEEEVNEEPAQDMQDEVFEPEEETPAIKKSSPKKRAKKVPSQDAASLKEYTLKKVEEMGGTVFYPATEIKFNAFKVDGKMFAILHYSGKSITLGCREVAVKELGIEPSNIINHTFNYNYRIEQFNEENTALIDKLLTACMEKQVAKNSSKKEKATKKKEA